jgi:hypothetical protein
MKTSHLLLISFLLLWLSCDKETSIKEPTDEPNNEQVNDQGMPVGMNSFFLKKVRMLLQPPTPLVLISSDLYLLMNR